MIPLGYLEVDCSVTTEELLTVFKAAAPVLSPVTSPTAGAGSHAGHLQCELWRGEVWARPGPVHRLHRLQSLQPGLRLPNNTVCFRNVLEMSARLPGLAPSCHRQGHLSLLLALASAVLGNGCLASADPLCPQPKREEVPKQASAGTVPGRP